jgi:integrase
MWRTLRYETVLLFVCGGVRRWAAFAMRLLACTFVRTSELIEAEWLEFDLENSRWDIPAERMKMDTPHIVPLSRQAVEVLRALKLLTGKGMFVFPGANDKNKPMSNNTILFALYRLGYKGRMTLELYKQAYGGYALPSTNAISHRSTSFVPS